MCYGQRLPSLEDVVEIRVAENENTAVAENLRDRIAETEVRLERARAREAEMSRRLDQMKKFVNVMEILETYLRRRYKEQQDHLVQLYSSPPSVLVTSKEL
ncbi:protein skip34 [Phtheirospermum japonicum]|uniref:Protein skip34 n=1 Tax=Phtheirospermum japonicum TaxID=374723 RepID=A0A830BXK8_9LAMI|nr:protein skip34 [Phtheirospermum japonicum]